MISECDEIVFALFLGDYQAQSECEHKSAPPAEVFLANDQKQVKQTELCQA
jgi:hypothetical protein